MNARVQKKRTVVPIHRGLVIVAELRGDSVFMGVTEASNVKEADVLFGCDQIAYIERGPNDVVLGAMRDALIRLTGEPETPPEVTQGLNRILTRIGSWTNTRWDQHLRSFFGDEATDMVIGWLAERGILPHIPNGSGRLLQEKITEARGREKV